MQNKTVWSIVIIVIAVAAIVLIAVFARKPSNQTVVPNDQNSDQSGAVQNEGKTSGSQSSSGSPSGSNIIRSTRGSLVNYQSDLVSFSVAPGAHLLGQVDATGIIDASYTSNGKIDIELADQNYATMKTVSGSVTGSAKTGNVTFHANINTGGIKKGAGYIIFRQVSGDHYARVAVIFD